WDEAAQRNLVEVLVEPRKTRLGAAVQLDRPRGTRDRIRRLRAALDRFVGQTLRAHDLPRLAHADLYAGVVDERVLAAGERRSVEALVFAHLAPTLDLGLGQFLGDQRMEFASVATHHAGGVAQQLVRPSGREEEDLRAGKPVLARFVRLRNLLH